MKNAFTFILYAISPLLLVFFVNAYFVCGKEFANPLDKANAAKRLAYKKELAEKKGLADDKLAHAGHNIKVEEKVEGIGEDYQTFKKRVDEKLTEYLKKFQ